MITIKSMASRIYAEFRRALAPWTVSGRYRGLPKVQPLRPWPGPPPESEDVSRWASGQVEP